MGYPTSIFSPTSKNTGDTIQASHVNDLQTEVTAIETELITGPIELPTSTVANLSVTGVSTFAGVATFTVQPLLPRQPICKVTHSAAQEVASGVFGGLLWDTEDYDSTGMHSTATNSSRIALNSTGLWTIAGQVTWVGNATPIRQMRIFLDDLTPIAGDLKAAINIDPYPQQITARYLATSTTHYVTLSVACNGSTGRANGTDGTFGGSWFSAERVSQ